MTERGKTYRHWYWVSIITLSLTL